MKTLLDLGPHDTAMINPYCWVIRVPGGFIYLWGATDANTSCFVPLSEKVNCLNRFPLERES